MTSKQLTAEHLSKSVKKPISTSNKRVMKLTEQEIQSRKTKQIRLEALGISASKFDTDNEYEDCDILEAMILIEEGKEIPKELEEKLKLKQENINDAST